MLLDGVRCGGIKQSTTMTSNSLKKQAVIVSPPYRMRGDAYLYLSPRLTDTKPGFAGKMKKSAPDVRLPAVSQARQNIHSLSDFNKLDRLSKIAPLSPLAVCFEF